MDEKYLYLNLQQQVGKNKADIEELRTIKFNLERAGVRVVGEEASASDLPDPVTYGGDLGDAYLIGSEPPYQMYIYTQPSVGETNFKWFNIGAFPAVGPQGEQGPEGPTGPQGDASNWRFGTVNPSILDTDKEHDGYLNTTTGMVYEFSGTRWVPIGSILGPRGQVGPEGPTGPQGPMGQQGPQGIQGIPGVVIDIIAVVANTGSLPDPDSVSRNAGYIVDDTVNRDLYIIVEDENQDLTWYNAGPFTGTPGAAAGFGTIVATVTPISPSASPSVTVTTSGANTAKNISFAFSLPVGAELEDTDVTTPSNTKGYTQKIIAWRTMNRIIRNDSGITFPTTTQAIIAMMQSNLSYSMALISNDTDYGRILDTPKPKGQLFITQGSAMRNYDVKFVDDAYNVYIYAGASGTPETAQWYRLMTTHDAEIVGTPAGGTEHQLLAKKSDEDFDTEWVNVPNAPNGVPQGGTQGQILAKVDGQNYNGEWVDAPNGIPNGGAQGQIMVKQSNANGDVAWANPPVGLPSGGSQDQVLAKSSGTDFAVQWKTPNPGIPSGGTTGQVLQKSSGTDYAVEWATPASGGGGAPISYGKNLIINPFLTINQRGPASFSSGTATYTADRWYYKGDGSGMSIGTAATSNDKTFLFTSGGTVSQFIEMQGAIMGTKYLLFGVRHSTEAPTITIKDNTHTAITAQWSKTLLEKSIDGIYQTVVMVEVTGPAANLNSYIEMEISFPTGSIGTMYAAYCYILSDTISSNDFTKPVAIAPINEAEELEKCKYYYVYVSKNGTVYTTGNGSNRTYIQRVYFNSMRISPTRKSQGWSVEAYSLTSVSSTPKVSFNISTASNFIQYSDGYNGRYVIAKFNYTNPDEACNFNGTVSARYDAEIYP